MHWQLFLTYSLLIWKRTTEYSNLKTWLKLHLITVINQCVCYFVVVEPPSNLIATEVSSKYIKLSWNPSPSAVTGYKVLLTPMTAGSRHHALSVGPQTTTLSVRDLSADTEYQISISALKGLTSSESISIMEKTQPMKVQVGKLQMHVKGCDMWRSF